MSDDYKQAHFFHGEESFKRVATICIGSGRFLVRSRKIFNFWWVVKIFKMFYISIKRGVFVPVAEQLGGVILFQPRGREFVEYLYKNNGIYEVDTVQRDGSVQLTQHKVFKKKSIYIL